MKVPQEFRFFLWNWMDPADLDETFEGMVDLAIEQLTEEQRRVVTRFVEESLSTLPDQDLGRLWASFPSWLAREPQPGHALTSLILEKLKDADIRSWRSGERPGGRASDITSVTVEAGE